MEEKKKFPEDIRSRIVNGFSINRIPPKKKEWFVTFAKEEFCDDRGLLLSKLIDDHKELVKLKKLLYGDLKWNIDSTVILAEKK